MPANDDFALEKDLVDRVRFIMDIADCPWFYCFGKLLGFVRDHDYNLNYDIDIGVILDRCDPLIVRHCWESNQFEMSRQLIDDVTQLPLNMHFKAVDDGDVPVPEIDIYFWYRHENMLYHTYDVMREGKKIPSTYIFKGVPSEMIEPAERLITGTMERDETMTRTGQWQYDIFGEGAGYTFRLPYAYGSLLDLWYPGWLYQRRWRGESVSPYVVKLKSCKDWGTV